MISGALLAAATTRANAAAAPNLPVFGVALGLLGAAIGLYHPPGTAMVSAVVERRGRAFVVHGIVGNLGVSAVPAIASTIAVLLNWRAAYVVLAVLAFCVALLVRRLAPDRDEACEHSRLTAEAVID